MPNLPLSSPIQATGLLLHLFAVMPESKRVRVKSLLQSGRVHVNGVSVVQHNHQVGPKDRIETRTERAIGVRSLPFPVLFEDKHLLAIEKPSGLLTVANKFEKTRAVLPLLAKELRLTNERPFVVQRLDLYTSGVLVLAKTEDAQSKIMRNWGASQKTYHALVEGTLEKTTARLVHFLREDEQLIMHASLAEKPRSVKASLSYRVIEEAGAFSLLEIKLETGKKNQIRVQLAFIGHPLAGDSKYGAKSNPINRLALHASRLSLAHPVSGKPLVFESPLPRGFRRADRQG